MRTDSYASILSAVGSVLDLADARSFAVCDGEHGMTLELEDGRGKRQSFELSITDVAELIAWSQQREAPHERVAEGRDEGTLHAFLERQALVAAR